GVDCDAVASTSGLAGVSRLTPNARAIRFTTSKLGWALSNSTALRYFWLSPVAACRSCCFQPLSIRAFLISLPKLIAFPPCRVNITLKKKKRQYSRKKYLHILPIGSILYSEHDDSAGQETTRETALIGRRTYRDRATTPRGRAQTQQESC